MGSLSIQGRDARYRELSRAGVRKKSASVDGSGVTTTGNGCWHGSHDCSCPITFFSSDGGAASKYYEAGLTGRSQWVGPPTPREYIYTLVILGCLGCVPSFSHGEREGKCSYV